MHACVLAWLQLAADLMVPGRMFWWVGAVHQKTSVLSSCWAIWTPLQWHAVRLETTAIVAADMTLLHILPIDQCVCHFINIWLKCCWNWTICQDCGLLLSQRIVLADLHTSFQIRDLNVSLYRRHGPFSEAGLLFSPRSLQLLKSNASCGLRKRSHRSEAAKCCEQEVRPERCAQEGVWLRGGIVRLFSSHCCGKPSKTAWFTLKSEGLVQDFSWSRR